MATFQGKVFYRSVVNGKEQAKIEKSFTDQKSFNDFVRKHQDKFQTPAITRPHFTPGAWTSFQTLMDRMLGGMSFDFPRLQLEWTKLNGNDKSAKNSKTNGKKTVSKKSANSKAKATSKKTSVTKKASSSAKKKTASKSNTK